MEALDQDQTPMYGTARLGEYGRAQRDRTHERTRPPGERLIVNNRTPKPNELYPGIQELSASRLTRESGEVMEIAASQMGASVFPLNVRRKSVLVNEIPLELGETERETEVRTIVVQEEVSKCIWFYHLYPSYRTSHV